MMNRAKMFRSSAAVPPSKVVTRSVAAGHPEIELRYTEVRATSSPTGNKRLEGYAAVFNTRAQLPGFQERIMPGAFKRAIADGDDCVCLFNHDSNLVLGRTTSGTLQLDEDSRGLHYMVNLPDTTAGRDAWESVKRADVNGSSFGFTVDPDGQSWSQENGDDGVQYVLRSITSVKLLDVSPVVSPAYQGTAVQARTAQVPAEVRSMAMKYFKMPTEAECLAITHRAEIRRQQEQIVQRRQAIIKSWLLD